MQKNYALEIFRILCCLGVLVYHTVDDVLFLPGGSAAALCYYGASFCVPGFFLLSGFLLANKKDVSLAYCEEKIKLVMGKLLGWVIFWVSVQFLLTADRISIEGTILAAADSGGMLPVAWFLFTYSVLMGLAYPLFQFYKKAPRLFSLAVFCWMLLLWRCAFDNWNAAHTQSLWLQQYAGYFALGMVVNRLYNKIQPMRKQFLAVFPVSLVLSSWLYRRQVAVSHLEPTGYYGRWFYTLWLVSLLMCLLLLPPIQSAAAQALLQKIGKNTFAVYLGHLPILLYITNIHPLANLAEALGMVVFLFVLCNGMAELFKKLPLLRALV